jgi:hypothetical protein
MPDKYGVLWLSVCVDKKAPKVIQGFLTGLFNRLARQIILIFV